ncbi:hypothetical protein VTN31DRAFT_2147 [Thermomyces dupontii]|uniref:uncharacterized protein n=1 Tax=Talaromyces thermophilus TaxID=28565 RepID=UPI003743039D
MGYSLKNRNVLVAGGSRGLGAAIAEKFAAEGANVAVNYLSNETAAQEVVSKINAQYPEVKTIIIQGDTGVQSDCIRIVRTAVEALGGLDILVSNAGWTKITNFGDLYAMNEDEWDKSWAVNVKGHFHLFREAVPHFNANPDGGAFLISASTAGLIPGGSSLAYSVAKAAAIHLMRGLAKTHGPKIRVNALCPGLLLTDWGHRFPESVINGYIDNVPLNKAPEVDEVADLCVSVAKNTSITGQAIAIDSGLTMR